MGGVDQLDDQEEWGYYTQDGQKPRELAPAEYLQKAILEVRNSGTKSRIQTSSNPALAQEFPSELSLELLDHDGVDHIGIIPELYASGLPIMQSASSKEEIIAELTGNLRNSPLYDGQRHIESVYTPDTRKIGRLESSIQMDESGMENIEQNDPSREQFQKSIDKARRQLQLELDKPILKQGLQDVVERTKPMSDFVKKSIPGIENGMNLTVTNYITEASIDKETIEATKRLVA